MRFVLSNGTTFQCIIRDVIVLWGRNPYIAFLLKETTRTSEASFDVWISQESVDASRHSRRHEKAADLTTLMEVIGF